MEQLRAQINNGHTSIGREDENYSLNFGQYGLRFYCRLKAEGGEGTETATPHACLLGEKRSFLLGETALSFVVTAREDEATLSFVADAHFVERILVTIEAELDFDETKGVREFSGGYALKTKRGAVKIYSKNELKIIRTSKARFAIKLERVIDRGKNTFDIGVKYGKLKF